MKISANVDNGPGIDQTFQWYSIFQRDFDNHNSNFLWLFTVLTEQVKTGAILKLTTQSRKHLRARAV